MFVNSAADWKPSGLSSNPTIDIEIFKKLLTKMRLKLDFTVWLNSDKRTSGQKNIDTREDFRENDAVLGGFEPSSSEKCSPLVPPSLPEIIIFVRFHFSKLPDLRIAHSSGYPG